MRPTGKPATIIDEFEIAFQDCIMPLVTEDVAVGLTYQDEQKTTSEFLTKNFIELSRRTEAYFLKQKALLAHKHPELVLQEEVDELELELKRKDDVINSHYARLKQWQNTLKDMKSVEHRLISNQPQHGSGQVHK